MQRPESGLTFKLNLNEVIPFLALPSNLRKEVSTWDLKQFKNLVIFFNHGFGCEFCRGKVRALASLYPLLREQNTEVLAVSFDTVEKLEHQAAQDGVPFPLLSDKDHKTTEEFTYLDEQRSAPYPSIFITDRYGELRKQQIALEANQLMSEVEVFSKIFAIEIECPECSHL